MAAEAQGFQVAPVKTAWPARAAMFKVVDFPRRFAAAFAARVRGDVGVTTAPPPCPVAVATVAPVPVCGTAARPVQQHDRTARFGAQVGRVACHAQQRAATKSARLCDRLRDLRLVAGAGQNVNDDHSVVALRKIPGASVRLAEVDDCRFSPTCGTRAHRECLPSSCRSCRADRSRTASDCTSCRASRSWSDSVATSADDTESVSRLNAQATATPKAAIAIKPATIRNRTPRLIIRERMDCVGWPIPTGPNQHLGETSGAV